MPNPLQNASEPTPKCLILCVACHSRQFGKRNFHQYSLMRVTQNERPSSVLHIKEANDENDPFVGNVTEGEKEGRMAKLKRQFLRKMAEAQTRHGNELLAINKQHQQEIKVLTEKYRRQLADKDVYIHHLEQMIKTSPLQNSQPAVNLSVVHTEHSRVPHYQEISGSIDFKLQPRTFEKQLSLDGRLLAKRKIPIHTHCQNSTETNKDSSKHKLIPKEKPSESHSSISPSEREDYWQHSIKIPRPFFL